LIEIRTIRPEDNEGWDLFFGLAERVYEQDPIWAGESRDEVLYRSLSFHGGKGPWFEAYISVRDGFAIARGTASIDPRMKDINVGRTGFIGNFEALENEEEAVSILLLRIESDLSERGVTNVIAPRSGPMTMGLQIDRFDLPQTWKTPHNPQYYPGLLEKSGYRKKEDLLTFIMDMDTRIEHYPDVPGIKIRTIDPKNFDEEVSTFNSLNNRIFEKHPNFIPRTLEEDRILIMSILPLMDRELVLFAETDDGEPIGFLVTMPDHVQRFKGERIDRARLISIGLLDEFTGKGIGPMMGKRLKEDLVRKGYKELEGSWVLESNMFPIKGAMKLGAKPGRRFRTYQKDL
jgi:hypothetical protein